MSTFNSHPLELGLSVSHQAALGSDSASAILLHGQWKTLCLLLSESSWGQILCSQPLNRKRMNPASPSLCIHSVWWSSSSSLFWASKDNLPFALFEDRQLNSFQGRDPSSVPIDRAMHALSPFHQQSGVFICASSRLSPPPIFLLNPSQQWRCEETFFHLLATQATSAWKDWSSSCLELSLVSSSNWWFKEA